MLATCGKQPNRGSLEASLGFIFTEKHMATASLKQIIKRLVLYFNSTTHDMNDELSIPCTNVWIIWDAFSWILNNLKNKFRTSILFSFMFFKPEVYVRWSACSKQSVFCGISACKFHKLYCWDLIQSLKNT